MYTLFDITNKWDDFQFLKMNDHAYRTLPPFTMDKPILHDLKDFFPSCLIQFFEMSLCFHLENKLSGR